MPLSPLTPLFLMLEKVPGIGDRTLTLLIEGCAEKGWGLEDLLHLSEEQVQEHFHLPQSALQSWKEWREIPPSILELTQRLEALGIHSFTPLDLDYPLKLRAYYSLPPPILFAYGALDLLSAPCISILCSRNSEDPVMDFLAVSAWESAQSGWCLVSGHNTPPYQRGVLSAHLGGGRVLFCLDRGLFPAFHRNLARSPVLTTRIYDYWYHRDSDLAITPFGLEKKWLSRSGPERDRLVMAFADRLLVLQIREGGIMEQEVKYALSRNKEVWVCSDFVKEENANSSLIKKGAKPFKKEDLAQLLALSPRDR